MNPRDTQDSVAPAEAATLHSFLNCYLRETGDYEVIAEADAPIDADTDEVVHASLSDQGVDIYVPLRYQSLTGRHLFELPAVYRLANDEVLKLDYPTLVNLVTTELKRSRDDTGAGDELLLRVLKSHRNIERFVEARKDDEERLYGFNTSFRDAEQSLVFGHQLHPTPKSRQGIPPHKEQTYAPELRGAFSLAYFKADPSLVQQKSVRAESASEWVKSTLREDETVPESFVSEHVDTDDVLLPVHPWQAGYLREQPHVKENLGDGLEYVGQVGREFYPTSSVRTLYAPDSPFMVKASLNVKITNSERTNKLDELERGVAVTELLETELGDELAERFPSFDIVSDPGYLTLDLVEGESGFETVLRENPFRGDDAMNATPVVGLCQDHIGDGSSRLATLIETIAEREGRSTDAVSEDWFEQYLERSVRPILWLYLERGLGVEAHQQNSVLSLEDGYPDTFHYRDNQGYYLPESIHDRVDKHLPGIGERAESVCPDWIADERLRYYIILNNAFGLINAFGTAGLVEEKRLLRLLREELESLREFDRPSSSFLDELLTEPTVPCKANLLTRFHDMDELVGSLANQSVYVDIDNPLVTELEVVSP
ncbi:IucA/IucC family siderophore biosynthesis protein (plasmid) [Haloferax mediterranei ATCC 33500]|uniref:Iron transporter n=1 Tax=Haloferax mediterranei (strain ATCC 33500 / DSM 1411 / JCM 8866 / NBRC 14739 / NCIMB 2177 / R-4) TaxID=523841 RepID=I3R9H0_HALMT|nr:IucA/IucC family protein [Haloferax mediterranei]AFK20880.1 siderophore biosynthesis protein [Haloferax mediterranei ATCC 33500]AHZ24251.1 iron transporter [Haloferax mediterranei ATCC 33500]EMA05330.1 siderophore biosynthesis protein [Haloferax mediterranei ATCC 33500]MDX5989868.1 IucA/IucC family protein [Haloferax mediterranei ATCC 33500]QCQ77309.1 IucA/IucC family siderophore biosynthesis protein [Haloferax mediterranei ATCC 33500]